VEGVRCWKVSGYAGEWGKTGQDEWEYLGGGKEQRALHLLSV